MSKPKPPKPSGKPDSVRNRSIDSWGKAGLKNFACDWCGRKFEKGETVRVEIYEVSYMRGDDVVKIHHLTCPSWKPSEESK